jgi:hypothetical protein
MKKLALIVIDGQYFKLVPEAALVWINYDIQFDSKQTRIDQEVPQPLIDSLKEMGIECQKYVSTTIGSQDNDRAIQLPGLDFYSSVEAFKFAMNNDCEIVGEYHGLEY